MRQPEPTATKLRKLEALRGFAAAYVVLHHALPRELPVAGINLAYLFRFGQEAVILFFLLSGFVINYAFRRSADQRFSTFLGKRAARIYIPLLLVFALDYLMASLRAGHAADLQPTQLLLNLLMLQDASDIKPGTLANPYLGNTPLWSLAYEWWFYMAYYALMARVGSEALRCRLVMGLAVAAAGLYFVWPHFLVRLPMYLCIWWVGVEISNLHLSGRPVRAGTLKESLAGLAAVTALLAANAAAFVRASAAPVLAGLHPVLELRHFAFALVAVIAALAWSRVHWFGFDATLGRFAAIAPISYALYIAHYNLVGDNSPLQGVAAGGWFWLLTVALVWAVAYGIEVIAYPRLRRLVELHLGLAVKPIVPET